jgi:hypothetical protein
MPTLANMNIEVSADIKQLLDGMGRAGKSLGDFNNQLKRFQDNLKTATNPDSILRLNRAIEASKERISQISSAGIGANGGLKKLSDGSNQAAFALNNLSRVAQDAPYGFIGISNNINPLLESFQRLKAETGSNKEALKALASSFLGAGGLGLAVGIGTALLTVFGDKLFATSKKVNEAEEAAKKYKDTVASIFSNAGKEATNVQSLIAVLQSETATRERKLAVMKDLKNINPEVFSQLKIEGNTVLGLDAAYKSYIENIQKVIRVKLLQQRLEDVTTKIIKANGGALLKSEQQILDIFKKSNEERSKTIKDARNPIIEKQLADQKKLNFLLSDQEKLQKDIQEIQQGVDVNPIPVPEPKKIKTAKDVIAELRKEIEALNVELKGGFISADEFSQKFIDAYQKAVSDLSKIGASPVTIKEISLEAAPAILKDQLKKFKAFIAKNFEEDPIPVPVEGTIVTTISDVQAKLAILGEAISRQLTENEAKFFQIKIGPNISIEGVKEKLAAAKALFAQWQADVKGILGQLRSDLISGVAESVGKAIASGNSSDLFSGILQILGDGIIAIGKKIVALSTLFKVLQNALKVNPAAALPIGISLIVLGSVMKNLKIPGFAEGVTNFRGGTALVGERGPELVNLPRGSDVIPNHALGGMGAGGAIQVTGTLRASGTELLVIIDRAIERRLRNG